MDKREKKKEYDRQRYERKKEILKEKALDKYYKNLPQEKIEKKIRALEKLGYRVEKVPSISG